MCHFRPALLPARGTGLVIKTGKQNYPEIRVRAPWLGARSSNWPIFAVIDHQPPGSGIYGHYVTPRDGKKSHRETVGELVIGAYRILESSVYTKRPLISRLIVDARLKLRSARQPPQRFSNCGVICFTEGKIARKISKDKREKQRDTTRKKYVKMLKG